MKANFALRKLGASFSLEQNCHEACGYQREIYKKIIFDYWNEGLARKVEKIILSEKEDIDWRQELVYLLALKSPESAPEYLSNYLTKPEGDERLKSAIIKNFPLSSEDYVQTLVDKINNDSLGEQERVAAAETLARIDDPDLASLYWQIVENNSSYKVRLKMLFPLRYSRKFEEYHDSNSLPRLEKMIFDPEVDVFFKKPLADLAVVLYFIYPEETQDLLLKICQAEELDKFTRLEPANYLLSLGEKNCSKPVISSAEWSFCNKNEVAARPYQN